MPDGQVVPTAPGRVPGLGHVLALRSRPVDFMMSLRAEGDIVRVFFGPKPVYVINSPALIREMLVTQRGMFEKGMLFDKARQIFGDGLVTSNGEHHRRQRRLVQPAFRPEQIARYGEHMSELAEAMAASWRSGTVVAVDREMADLTLGVVSRTLFSSAIGERAAAEVRECLPIIVDGLIRRTVSPASFYEHVPTPGNRRFVTVRARLFDVIDEVIQAYRDDPADHGDLLSILMRARDDGTAMTDAQLREELITMMLSGSETTAVALSWVFHELGRHSEAEARVHAEVEAVREGGRIGGRTAARLEYTGRVVTEALRLHTPPWIVMRRARAAVELGGYRVPGGAEVAISPAALHRDGKLFPEPLRFDPDRWLPERAKALDKAAFIPFGTGDRRCIGEAFAVTEMKIAISTVISRHRLTPAPGSRVREVAGTVLHPDALPMVAEAW